MLLLLPALGFTITFIVTWTAVSYADIQQRHDAQRAIHPVGRPVQPRYITILAE